MNIILYILVFIVMAELSVKAGRTKYVGGCLMRLACNFNRKEDQADGEEEKA